MSRVGAPSYEVGIHPTENPGSATTICKSVHRCFKLNNVIYVYLWWRPDAVHFFRLLSKQKCPLLWPKIGVTPFHSIWLFIYFVHKWWYNGTLTNWGNIFSWQYFIKRLITMYCKIHDKSYKSFDCILMSNKIRLWPVQHCFVIHMHQSFPWLCTVSL